MDNTIDWIVGSVIFMLVIGLPALGLVSELFGLRLSFLGMGVLVLLLLPIYPLLRRPQN